MQQTDINIDFVRWVRALRGGIEDKKKELQRVVSPRAIGRSSAKACLRKLQQRTSVSLETLDLTRALIDGVRHVAASPSEPQPKDVVTAPPSAEASASFPPQKACPRSRKRTSLDKDQPDAKRHKPSPVDDEVIVEPASEKKLEEIEVINIASPCPESPLSAVTETCSSEKMEPVAPVLNDHPDKAVAPPSASPVTVSGVASQPEQRTPNPVSKIVSPLPSAVPATVAQTVPQAVPLAVPISSIPNSSLTLKPTPVPLQPNLVSATVPHMVPVSSKPVSSASSPMPHTVARSSQLQVASIKPAEVRHNPMHVSVSLSPAVTREMLKGMAKCVRETEAEFVRLDKELKKFEQLPPAERNVNIVQALLDSTNRLAMKAAAVKACIDRDIAKSFGLKFYPELLSEVQQDKKLKMYSTVRLMTIINLLLQLSDTNADPNTVLHSFAARAFLSERQKAPQSAAPPPRPTPSLPPPQRTIVQQPPRVSDQVYQPVTQHPRLRLQLTQPVHQTPPRPTPPHPQSHNVLQTVTQHLLQQQPVQQTQQTQQALVNLGQNQQAQQSQVHNLVYSPNQVVQQPQQQRPVAHQRPQQQFVVTTHQGQYVAVVPGGNQAGSQNMGYWHGTQVMMPTQNSSLGNSVPAVDHSSNAIVSASSAQPQPVHQMVYSNQMVTQTVPNHMMYVQPPIVQTQVQYRASTVQPFLHPQQQSQLPTLIQYQQQSLQQSGFPAQSTGLQRGSTAQPVPPGYNRQGSTGPVLVNQMSPVARASSRDSGISTPDEFQRDLFDEQCRLNQQRRSS